MNDRLAELQRGKPAGTDDVAVEMQPDESGMAAVMAPFEMLKNNVKTVEEDSAKIKALQKQAARASTEDELKAVMKQLDDVMDEVNGVGRKSKALITELKSSNDRYEKDNPHSASSAWRRNLLNTQARHFQEAITMFQDASGEFKNSLRDRIARQARIVTKKELNDDEIDELIHSENPMQYMQDALMMPDSMVDRVADIEERHEGILKIERGVRELQELFNDLAFLVELQGEKLDNIQHNITQTNRYAEQATGHLVKSEQHEKSARKKQCYLLMCILVVLLIIIIPTVGSA